MYVNKDEYLNYKYIKHYTSLINDFIRCVDLVETVYNDIGCNGIPAINDLYTSIVNYQEKNSRYNHRRVQTLMAERQSFWFVAPSEQCLKKYFLGGESKTIKKKGKRCHKK